MDENREPFLTQEIDAFLDDMGDPVGTVSVHANETVTCWTEWGGWQWQAEATTRENALRRLEARLMRLNPFDGADTDWGDPGHQLGALDSRIPESVREQMQDVSRRRGDVIPEDTE